MDFCGDHASEQQQRSPAPWCAGGCGQPAEKGRDLCCDCAHKVQPPPQAQPQAPVSATERAIRKLTGMQPPADPAEPAHETEPPDLAHDYLVRVVGADAVRLTMDEADEPDAAGDVLSFAEAYAIVYPRLSAEDQPKFLRAMDAMREQDEVSLTFREKRTRRGFPTQGNPPGRPRGRPRSAPED